MPTVPHHAEHPKDDSILNSPSEIGEPISMTENTHIEATQEAPIGPSDKPAASPPLLPPRPGPGISSNDTKSPIAIFAPSVLEPSISTTLNPEWTRIKRLRSEIWSQRSRVQEMRGSLRDKQDRKATADDNYIQYVRLRGHGVQFGNRTSSDEQTEIDVLFDACVTAREEYGPLEDALNAIETNLSVNEFELDRLERKFYDQPSKPQVPPMLNPGNEDVSSISPSVASTDSGSESGQQFHPLVTQYLSRLGDVDLLRERLDELLEERYMLEEEREKRARVKMKLSDENEEWLANYSHVESGLIEEYENATKEMEKLKKECIGKGLVDATGEPLSLEHLERRTFAGDLDGDAGRESSEYVKFPKLIPQPGNKVTNTLPESLLNVNEPAFISSVRVNRWILDQLRTSPMEVGLLARTFESRYGPINESEKWQSDVLQLWYRDGAQDGWLAGRASSVAITMAPRDTGSSTSSSSLETQIPPWNIAGEISRSPMFSSEDDSVRSVDNPSARKSRRPIQLVKGKEAEHS
ncbi:hypothetical protein IFR05_009374 [Cadophora sp. M221]|nr:hypothetical protein IFR05_009374 [Cadophora sp. M221]